MEAVLGQPITQYVRDSMIKQKFSVSAYDTNSVDTVYHELKQTILDYMADKITMSTKFRMCFAMDLSIPEKDDYNNNFTRWGEQTLIYPQSDFESVLDKQVQEINASVEDFTEGGSGWRIDLVHTIGFEFYGFQQLNGSGTFVELPPKLANKRLASM